MNNVVKNIIGFVIFLLIVTAALGMFLSNLTKKSFYDESGSVIAEELKAEVNIYSDDFGVPYIFSEKESDMYFALGYMHARDRLWQMDLYRRVAQGRLAEVLGNDAAEFDVLFRTIGIDKASISVYQTLSQDSKRILSSYTAGVNFFIDQNISRLPLEFDILNYKPEPWTPDNSIMIVRLMAWELNLSWYTDVMFGNIVKKTGMPSALDFFPSYPDSGPFIVKQTQQDNSSDTSNVREKSGMSDSSKAYRPSSGDLADAFYERCRKFKNFIGSDAIHIGSNSWVVSGKKTESGKPMLANDPHLALQAPSKWYEVNLYNGEKKINVGGFTLPGAPGVAIGRNDFLTWGLTNLMCDDADFYLLKRDSADFGKYFYKSERLELDSTVESVKIKDSADDLVFTVYRTKLGPVVSGLKRTGFVNNQSFNDVPGDRILTFRWTGFEKSDEILSFYKINFAEDSKQFSEALSSFGSPALNFVYADTSGNIGYHAAGLVPVRETSDPVSAMYPFEESSDWLGFVPFPELPQAMNPPSGFIATANNKPAGQYKYYISGLYEPHYRASRIEELLSQSPVFTVEEMKLLQRDVYSIQAKEFCEHLLKAFGDSSTWSSDIKAYLNLLTDWDYEFKTSSTGASLFSMFEARLYENLYKDKLGEELFENYLFLKNIPVRNTSEILTQNSCLFFSSLEEKNQLLRKSFYEAVSELIKKHGTDTKNWQWGALHSITFRHPLGSFPLFTSMMNTGPFNVSGNGTTINNLEYGFFPALKNAEFEAYLGPSMRMIVDLSRPGAYYSILAGGQSGQPLQENYANQSRLWLNGDYKIVSSKFEDLRNSTLTHFSLEPAR